MRLVSFNFTKISCERLSNSFEGLKMNSSINLNSLDKLEGKSQNKEEFLSIKWSYSVSYDPEIAKADFSGEVIVAEESKKLKEILKSWEEQNLDDIFKTDILNVIMQKASIKAAFLEDELNLPPHFRLPSVSTSSAQKTEN